MKNLIFTFIISALSLTVEASTCTISGATSAMICAGETVSGVSGTAACMSATSVSSIDLSDKISQVVEIVASDTSGIAAGSVTISGTDAASFRLDPIKYTERNGSELTFFSKDGESAKFSVVKIANLSSSLSATLEYTNGYNDVREIEIVTSPASTFLEFWLNASTLTYSDLGNAGDDVDSSGDLSHGDRIANWTDLTGTSSVTNSTDAQKPKYVKQAFSTDSPGLYFDGANDLLTTAANVVGVDFDKNQKFTVLIVAHGAGTDNPNGGYAVGNINTVDWRGWTIRFLPYTAQSQIQLRATWADWAHRFIPDGEQDGGYSIITATFAGTNTTNTNSTGLGYYLDGENRGTSSADVGTMSGTTVSGGVFGVGALTNVQRGFKGIISEILIFSDELSAADRNHYECYLGGKYGVTRAINNSCP